MQEISWVPMRFSSLLTLYFKKEKMHMIFFFNLLQGTLIAFTVYIFSGVPRLLTLLECLALGTEKQCTVVKSNYHSSFTLSRLFAQSPNSSDAKELSRGCKERQLLMCSPQNNFYLLWSILMEGFSFSSSLLLGTQSLQSGQRKHPAVFGQEANCKNDRSFYNFFEKCSPSARNHNILQKQNLVFSSNRWIITYTWSMINGEYCTGIPRWRCLHSEGDVSFVHTLICI